MRLFVSPKSVTLVYQDAEGVEYPQPTTDIVEVGTLIDPETGDDLTLSYIIVDTELYNPASPRVAKAPIVAEMYPIEEPFAETSQLEHSKVVLSHHTAAKYAGRHCTIHNRSDHHMRDFPQFWRSDAGFMERICPHGIGHPDPDGESNYPVHGCDGCCSSQRAHRSTDDSIIAVEPMLANII